jgi:hypothetical protein
VTADGTIRCSACAATIAPDSEFCPRCGSLLIGGVTCEHHPSIEAVGACVICATPFCSQCGPASGMPFLCNLHSSYEVYEGMARIYGTFDPVHAEFLRGCLEQEGFHPFVYSRKASSIHIGGPEYTGFMSSGDSPRVIVNEFKLLVPCGEVLEAETILRQLDAPAGTVPDSP